MPTLIMKLLHKFMKIIYGGSEQYWLILTLITLCKLIYPYLTSKTMPAPIEKENLDK